MNYKCPPIYKYGFFLVVVYMYFKHQCAPSELLLSNAIILTLIMIMLDYIIVRDMPTMFEYKIKENNKKSEKDVKLSDEDINEIINSVESKDIDEDTA